ncbi:hypothetical protein V6N13_112103 [Hibiscus sabdariffa]|uniref:Rhodanese domain-containing protein n=1 Tax=Hibiscus sabdariffa TaxID=183260 RepID=A0ABR2TMR4_9ROSI
MASSLLSLTPFLFGRKLKIAAKVSQRCRDTAASVGSTKTSVSSAERRSANYLPCLYDDDLQLLRSDFKGDEYVRQVEELKGRVKMMLNNMEGDHTLDQLEMIDNLLRLGVAYYFEDDIHNILGNIYNNNQVKNDNLYATALEFRILREHGYLSSPVFDSFRDKTGKFRQSLCNDIKAMLSLYEASYHCFPGESIMEEAWNFTSKHLGNVKIDQVDPFLGIQVSQALELPLHWRMPRLEARWYIDLYERRADFDPIVLQLAKLDFNVLQGLHQEELKDMSKWWKNTGLGEKLSFARNRLVESFLWTVGMASKPQFGSCRKILTKVVAFITVIDDIYDVYGTLDELELFTDAVERWDIKAMEQLPDYMKICFFALYNAVNEMAYDILKDQGHDVVFNLKNAWAELLRAYLLEARWYHSGYTPSFDEYLKNAWISVATPLMAVHSSLFVTNQINQKELAFLESYPEFLYWSALIVRLQDDLGTSSEELKRGDVAKSIQCYMHENRVSEETGRGHIKNLVREAWKQLNVEGAAASPLSKDVSGTLLNLVRGSHCFYQHGDGHGSQNHLTKQHAMSLLFHPVPL